MLDGIVIALIGAAGAVLAAWISSRKTSPAAVSRDPTLAHKNGHPSPTVLSESTADVKADDPSGRSRSVGSPPTAEWRPIPDLQQRILATGGFSIFGGFCGLVFCWYIFRAVDSSAAKFEFQGWTWEAILLLTVPSVTAFLTGRFVWYYGD